MTKQSERDQSVNQPASQSVRQSVSLSNSEWLHR